MRNRDVTEPAIGAGAVRSEPRWQLPPRRSQRVPTPALGVVPAHSFGLRDGRRRWRAWLLVACAGLLVLGGRVLYQARSAVLAGERALAASDDETALTWFARASRMALPGSPFADRGLRGLRVVAESARQRGDVGLERDALFALRLAIATTGMRRGDTLAFANARLGELTAGLDQESGVSATARTQGLTDAGPKRSVAQVVATAGLVIWLGAFLLFCRRGIDRTLALRRRWALPCGIAFGMGLILFVAGNWR